MMKIPPLEYLRSLVTDIPALNQKLICCFENWKPEDPPITVAYGEIGDAIADCLADITPEAQSRIFEQIERGITSQDLELATALTTGLIEALVTKADQRTELWRKLEELFGPKSLGHALAWKNFGS